jgi:hypothetical protein
MRAARRLALSSPHGGSNVPASESPEYRRLHDELEQAQADLTRQLEQARRRRSRRMPRHFRSDPGMWGLKWFVFPAALIFMLVAGAIRFGPALAAAEGHGTAGGDTARVYARHGSRDWTADLAYVAFGGIGLGLWAWRVPYRATRSRVRRNVLGDWQSIASLPAHFWEGSRRRLFLCRR